MTNCERCGFEPANRTPYNEEKREIEHVCEYCFSQMYPEHYNNLSDDPCVKCGSRLNVVKHHVSYSTHTTIPLCAKCHRQEHKNAARPADSPRCLGCNKLLSWRQGVNGWVCKNWGCHRYWKYGRGPVIHIIPQLDVNFSSLPMVFELSPSRRVEGGS